MKQSATYCREPQVLELKQQLKSLVLHPYEPFFLQTTVSTSVAVTHATYNYTNLKEKRSEH